MTHEEIRAAIDAITNRRGLAWNVSVSRPTWDMRRNLDPWHAARLVVDLWSGEPTNPFVPADPAWVRATFGRRRRWNRWLGVARWTPLFLWLRCIL